MNQELQGEIGPNHRFAYSLKSDLVIEETRRSKWLSQWPQVKRWHLPHRQVHGDHIVDLDHQANDKPCDALISSDLSAGLGVWGSDCPGLIIVTGDAIAVAHCGWRGTALGLPQKLAVQLQSKSSRPVEHWHALIGPGICPSCYEVDQPVLRAHPWPPNCRSPSREGHAHLDLKLAIQAQLLHLGLSHVSISATCTAEHQNLHSFRHQGPGANQLLVVFPTCRADTK